MKSSLLLTSLIYLSCGLPSTKKDLEKTKNDTVVISKKITDEIAGSSYRKRATKFQLVNLMDTSKFSIIISESNNNEFDHEGSIYLEIYFDKNKNYKEQKQELKKILIEAARHYNLDSLKSIYSIWPPSLGDLNIKISKELENKNGLKAVPENYRKLCDFLLTSSLTQEMNDVFKDYKLIVKGYGIEHFGYSDIETLKEYSKIESQPNTFPKKIITGDLTIYF